MDEDEATWVGGGSFKVDREKALEKLAAYGLRGTHRFLETWVRAAVANEATRIEIRTTQEGLEIEFDGRGFTYDQLKDPYGVLFGKDKESTRDCRYLAIGILTLLPAKPGAIDIFYGIPGERFRTTITHAKGETTTRLKEEDRKTRIRVVSLEQTHHIGNALTGAEGMPKMCPARVFINGKESPRLPRCAEEPGAWVEDKGFRAWIGLPSDTQPGSFIELSVDGVVLDWIRMDDHDIRVHASVDTRDVAMNADHSKAVQNDRYRALSKKIQTASKALVEFAGTRLKKDFELDDWNSRAVRWLRDLADRILMDYELDLDDPFKKALWGCPLYRTVGEKVLSLAEIRQLEEKNGKVRTIVSDSKPQDDKSDTLWCRDSDEFNSLVARFALDD